MTLQLELESIQTRLSDVFPFLRKALLDFQFIAEQSGFTGEALEALRTIITNFYKRFFFKDQGDLYALAYLYTPAGLTAYLRYHFTWRDVHDISIHYDNPSL